MFNWCGGSQLKQIVEGSKVQVKQNVPQPCQRHGGKSIKFVCQSCIDQSLLCQDCLIDHKDHNWLLMQNFFSESVLHLLQTGESRNGKVIEECVERLVIQLGQYQQKIENKIKQFVEFVINDLQKLKIKFPVEGGYNLSSNKITNKTMGQILRIISGEKYVFDTRRLQLTYNQILRASQINIFQNVNLAKVALCDHEWELLTEKQVIEIQSNYFSVYRKEPPVRKFYFSLSQHSKGIDFENNRLTAIYREEVPKYPLTLVDRYMSSDLHMIGFKITRMETHLKFFNMSVVYVGVCHPSFAEKYGYLDIGRASRGAYMISSSGMTYHSKYPQYHQSNVAFSFGKGDIITVDLDINDGTITFEKKTAVLPLLKKVQMSLGLQKTYLTQLKPCIMFSSNIGAQVTILNQTQLRLELDGRIVYPVKKN